MSESRFLAHPHWPSTRRIFVDPELVPGARAVLEPLETSAVSAPDSPLPTTILQDLDVSVAAALEAEPSQWYQPSDLAVRGNAASIGKSLMRLWRAGRVERLQRTNKLASYRWRGGPK